MKSFKNITFSLGLYFVTSCVQLDLNLSGEKTQAAAIQAASGQRYSYTKKIIYDELKNQYIMTGLSTVTSKNPNLEPPSIFNSFKCYFVRKNKIWVAKPAKKNEASSTLIAGYLVIDAVHGTALVQAAKLSTFDAYAPAVEPNGVMTIGRDQETVVFK